MKQEFERQLARQATFISGSPAQNRELSESSRSAVTDAIQVVANLPNSMQSPYVTSGTTADPTTILALTWYSYTHGVKSVNVECKGNSDFVVSWDLPNGQRSQEIMHSVDDLLSLDLQEKVAQLEKTDGNPKVYLDHH